MNFLRLNFRCFWGNLVLPPQIKSAPDTAELGEVCRASKQSVHLTNTLAKGFITEALGKLGALQTRTELIHRARASGGGNGVWPPSHWATRSSCLTHKTAVHRCLMGQCSCNRGNFTADLIVCPLKEICLFLLFALS